MEKKSRNLSKKLQTMGKFLLTGFALFLVFKKIDEQQLLELVKSLNYFWLIPAILLFILSKVATAFRLNLYFKNIGIEISERLNWRLYLVGMFYNLFLPGGIGGDGYKIYLLHRQFKTSMKKLLQAVFLDRFGGLIAIVFLLLCLFLVVDIHLDFFQKSFWKSFVWLGMLLTLPAFWLIQKIAFQDFLPSFWKGNLWSFTGQIAQLICAWFILKALGVESNFLSYQLVFLLSSIVSVLPLTIGGVGARELVFVYAHSYAGIEETTAVAFSLLFFLITAGVSLIGSWIKVDLKEA